MPYNYDSSSLKQAPMIFFRNSAEALAQVGTVMKMQKVAVAGADFTYYFS